MHSRCRVVIDPVWRVISAETVALMEKCFREARECGCVGLDAEWTTRNVDPPPPAAASPSSPSSPSSGGGSGGGGAASPTSAEGTNNSNGSNGKAPSKRQLKQQQRRRRIVSPVAVLQLSSPHTTVVVRVFDLFRMCAAVGGSGGVNLDGQETEEEAGAGTAERSATANATEENRISATTYTPDSELRGCYYRVLNAAVPSPLAPLDERWPSSHHRAGVRYNHPATLLRVRDAICALLKDDRVFKFGAGIGGDKAKLEEDYPEVIECVNSCVDLSSLHFLWTQYQQQLEQGGRGGMETHAMKKTIARLGLADTTATTRRGGESANENGDGGAPADGLITGTAGGGKARPPPPQSMALQPHQPPSQKEAHSALAALLSHHHHHNHQEPIRPVSLKNLCEMYTGGEMGKDMMVVLSDWAGGLGALSPLQVQYAAEDAEASLGVGMALLQKLLPVLLEADDGSTEREVTERNCTNNNSSSEGHDDVSLVPRELKLAKMEELMRPLVLQHTKTQRRHKTQNQQSHPQQQHKGEVPADFGEADKEGSVEKQTYTSAQNYNNNNNNNNFSHPYATASEPHSSNNSCGSSASDSVSVTEADAEAATWVVGRTKPYYDNISVYNPQGTLVFTVDRAKAEWYLKKDLAHVTEWVPGEEEGEGGKGVESRMTEESYGFTRDAESGHFRWSPSNNNNNNNDSNAPPSPFSAGHRPLTRRDVIVSIQLVFAPDFKKYNDAHIRRNLDYFKTPKQNICVVCGSDASLVRFAVIPILYRKFFPSVYMSHNSYDLLLLCGACFSASRAVYDQGRRRVAADYGIPLHSLTESELAAYVQLTDRLEREMLTVTTAATAEEREKKRKEEGTLDTVKKQGGGKSCGAIDTGDDDGVDWHICPSLKIKGMREFAEIQRHRNILINILKYAKALRSHYSAVAACNEVGDDGNETGNNAAENTATIKEDVSTPTEAVSASDKANTTSTDTINTQKKQKGKKGKASRGSNSIPPARLAQLSAYLDQYAPHYCYCGTSTFSNSTAHHHIQHGNSSKQQQQHQQKHNPYGHCGATPCVCFAGHAPSSAAGVEAIMCGHPPIEERQHADGGGAPRSGGDVEEEEENKEREEEEEDVLHACGDDSGCDAAGADANKNNNNNTEGQPQLRNQPVRRRRKGAPRRSAGGAFYNTQNANTTPAANFVDSPSGCNDHSRGGHSCVRPPPAMMNFRAVLTRHWLTHRPDVAAILPSTTRKAEVAERGESGEKNTEANGNKESSGSHGGSDAADCNNNNSSGNNNDNDKNNNSGSNNDVAATKRCRTSTHTALWWFVC